MNQAKEKSRGAEEAREQMINDFMNYKFSKDSGLVESYQDNSISTNLIGNTMPRKEQGWVTFQTSEEERQILEEFCQLSQRTKTEILRELVRGLNKHPSPTTSLPTKQEIKENVDIPELEIISQKKALKVSSRNILKGVIKRVVTGAVNSEVTLEIVHRVELTSIITRMSAEELELFEGTEAYAVIKSNDIVIARE